jgi:osmotically-inducible protein OsmY
MTDGELKRRVEDELDWEPRINAAEIGVAVSDGVVTLTGSVGSWPAKRAVEDAVKRVAGVLGIAGDIKVRLVGEERNDTEVARACVNALHWNTWVPRDHVAVRVEEGWVTLEGTLQSQYQREAAESAVRDLLGVKGVVNLILIRPRARPSNVKEAIHRAFERHARLDANSIGVDVHESKVTLHGVVRSWAERQDAEAAAWAAPGVAEVENRIRIAS